MNNQYVQKIWLKWLNLFLKITILSLTQMWKIRYLEQLLVQNLPHHIRVYIWTAWRISFSKMHKFSLRFGLGTLMIFFWSGQPVKKNLMIFWNKSINFHPNLSLRMSVLERKLISLMLLLKLIMVNLSPISTGNLLMAISTFTLRHVTLVTQNLEWEEFLPRKVILFLMFESLRTDSRKEAIQRIWSTRKQKVTWKSFIGSF